MEHLTIGSSKGRRIPCGLQGCGFFFFSRRILSVPASQRALCGLNQATQGLIYGLLVGKVLGDVRRKQHQIRSRSITFDILAPNAAIQFRQVVFSSQLVPPYSFLNFFLHSVLGGWSREFRRGAEPFGFKGAGVDSSSFPRDRRRRDTFRCFSVQEGRLPKICKASPRTRDSCSPNSTRASSPSRSDGPRRPSLLRSMSSCR